MFNKYYTMVYSRRIIEAKQNFGASLNIKGKAKELRKNMTEPEKILWNYLRKKQQSGMHFRRQHPFGIYILDFYCFEANLVIEIDGMIHLNQKDYDLERTKDLESSGLYVMRFNNSDVNERIDYVLGKINSYLKNYSLCKPNHFPPGGNRKGGDSNVVVTRKMENHITL
jgi:very-short-patch-repair endonuclease